MLHTSERNSVTASSEVENFRVIKMSLCFWNSPEKLNSACLAWLGQLGVLDHIHKKEKYDAQCMKTLYFKKILSFLRIPAEYTKLQRNLGKVWRKSISDHSSEMTILLQHCCYYSQLEAILVLQAWTNFMQILHTIYQIIAKTLPKPYQVIIWIATNVNHYSMFFYAFYY